MVMVIVVLGIVVCILVGFTSDDCVWQDACVFGVIGVGFFLTSPCRPREYYTLRDLLCDLLLPFAWYVWQLTELNN